jgi:Zn-dependent oligopeptidase
MAGHRAEVDAIAEGPWPPSFDDTIAALERSGDRVRSSRVESAEVR